MEVAISTGEASGDRAGGQLAREILALRPGTRIWGVGGSGLRAAGVEVFAESTRFAAIGVSAALPMLPRMLAERRRVFAEVLRRRPDVLVAIDAGAFHLGFGPWEGLCPFVRRRLPSTRILYYYPPGSWRRTLRSTTLGSAADCVATPFPWSETELRRLGVDARFVGHPLLDLVHPSAAPHEIASRYGVDLDHPVIGLFPGSRAQEIRTLLPVLFDAAARIHRRVPGVQFLLGLAPTVSRATVLEERERARWRWRRERERSAGATAARRGPDARAVPVPVAGPPDATTRRQKAWIERAGGAPGDGDFPLAIVEGATYDVMSVSDILLCTSGTATLEAAILAKPMVIVYKLGRGHEIEYRLIRKRLPAHVGMPNLLADRRICPELLQDDANPDSIASEAIALLLEPERLIRMREDLRNAVACLGEPGGAARTARIAIELVEGATPRAEA
ncbi:MAG: lipid-A-disaccharide synthase [Armatimonadota bacterium]